MSQVMRLAEKANTSIPGSKKHNRRKSTIIRFKLSLIFESSGLSFSDAGDWLTTAYNCLPACTSVSFHISVVSIEGR